MKAILTLGIVLGLIMIFANLEVAEQHEKNIEICTQNLIAIGTSIQVYQKETGDYPEWLSDLHHPKYLPDPDILICPADRLGGRAGFARNIDPKMPVSYGYQFHSKYRERIQENRIMYGDVVPLVRCRHHANPAFHCLNLSYSYKVTRSPSIWEAVPEQLHESPEQAIAAIEAGLQQIPDNERLSYYVYPSLARLYIETGQEEKVESLVNLFKSSVNSDYPRYYFTLSALLEMMDRDAELLHLFQELEKQSPNDRSVHQKLAEIYQKLGNDELGIKHRKKAEPVQALIGQPVPDFSATQTLMESQFHSSNIMEKSFYSIFGRHGPVYVLRTRRTSRGSTTPIRTKDLTSSVSALTTMKRCCGLTSKSTRLLGGRFIAGNGGRALSRSNTALVLSRQDGSLIETAY